MKTLNAGSAARSPVLIQIISNSAVLSLMANVFCVSYSWTRSVIYRTRTQYVTPYWNSTVVHSQKHHYYHYTLWHFRQPEILLLSLQVQSAFSAEKHLCRRRLCQHVHCCFGVLRASRTVWRWKAHLFSIEIECPPKRDCAIETISSFVLFIPLSFVSKNKKTW